MPCPILKDISSDSSFQQNPSSGPSLTYVCLCIPAAPALHAVQYQKGIPLSLATLGAPSIAPVFPTARSQEWDSPYQQYTPTTMN
eukprot:13301869-Ditylum_brightwellii.AAC.2